MREPWGAGPGLTQRFLRSSAQAGARQREKTAAKQRRAPTRPRPELTRAQTALLLVVVAMFVAAGILHLVSGGAHHTTHMTTLEQNIQARADVSLAQHGYKQTITSVLCIPTSTRRARCHLTASNGVQTSVTAYISANGKSFVTGP